MPAHFITDIHCHPSIKAYARSYGLQPGVQAGGTRNRSSIWYRDAPSLFDKLKNYIVSLTNFIQSDATSLMKGRVCVVCLSFYPQEKGFFVNRAGTGIVSDTLTLLATEFGRERINHVQAFTSYWEDLKLEMDFVLQQENKMITLDGKKVTYSIARSYSDIEAADREGTLGETKILFIPTIEGAHVFDQVMDCYLPWENEIPKATLDRTLERIAALRAGANGMLRPAFITLAHHFWNGLCGHARSLGGLVKCVVDQENGLDQGFTTAGRKVVAALLAPATDVNGIEMPPIMIDIKHMSRRSRLQYLEMLTEFPDADIPVIVSHAGVTGLSAPGGTNNTLASQEGLFMQDSINFFDDEILQVAITNGIFGIQLDERRIASKASLRKARGHIGRRNILYAWSRLVWNQVRHIAELLDNNGHYAWGIQCIGSDFDGIIDPINGYWTSRELGKLDDYLLMHAFNYLTGVSVPCPLKQERNRTVKAEDIVEKIMVSNALNLLSRILK